MLHERKSTERNDKGMIHRYFERKSILFQLYSWDAVKGTDVLMYIWYTTTDKTPYIDLNRINFVYTHRYI